MRAICGFLAAGLLATAPMAMAAQDRKVLGIELGAPLGLPECGPGEGSYPARTCFLERQAADAAAGGHEHRVYFPKAGAPPYVRGEVLVAVIDGRVESVHINTWGFEAQHGAMAALTQQFGNPTRASLKPGRGAARYRHQVQTAQWDAGDFPLTFDGVTGSIDRGLIKVYTHRHRKLTNR